MATESWHSFFLESHLEQSFPVFVDILYCCSNQSELWHNSSIYLECGPLEGWLSYTKNLSLEAFVFTN